MIISFGLTTKELLSGNKTVTRRDWSAVTFYTWVKAWTLRNLIHDAYDKNPRNGGVKIGTIKLTACPHLQILKNMKYNDLIAEGGMVHSVEDFCKLIGKKPNDVVTVIKFEFTPLREEKYAKN